MGEIVIKQSFEKKLEYQQRMRAKQIAKIQSPEYKVKQLDKAKEANQKRLEKLASKPPSDRKVLTQSKASKSPRRNQTLKASKPIKSKGTMGKARTKSEHALHDKLAAIGCIACINQGLIIPFSGSPVSIHHIAGRTSENAHEKVLPLCGWHHDVPMDQNSPEYTKYPQIFPIHAKGSVGGKKKWEEVNGKQYALLEQSLKMIGVET